MKRSIDPVLTVAKAATAAVLILVLASPAWADTTIKSTKSNTSDRTTINTTKSNTFKAATEPPAPPAEGTTVKSSKSNSSERGYTVNPTQRGVDKKDVYGPAKGTIEDTFPPKAGIVVSDPGVPGPKTAKRTVNKVDALTVKQAAEKDAAAAAARSRHDTVKNSISNIR